MESWEDMEYKVCLLLLASLLSQILGHEELSHTQQLSLLPWAPLYKTGAELLLFFQLLLNGSPPQRHEHPLGKEGTQRKAPTGPAS